MCRQLIGSFCRRGPSCVQLWKYTNPTPNAFDKDANDDFYTYHDVTPPVTAGAYTVGSYT